MNIESLLPFFLLLAVLLFAFAVEAAVMAFFKLKKFWPAVGVSLLVNLASLALIYFLAAPFLSLLGYDIGKPNGLNMQVQVILFLWWFAAVTEGILLSLFLRRQKKPQIFLVSVVMNTASFVFLYVFDIISH